MSEREPIDSLQIEIESSSTDASKSLDALVSSLRKLDRIGKSNSFLSIKKRLQGIAEVRFDTLDKQLRSITKNIKTLEIYKKALKNLEIPTPTIDTTSISNAVETVISETERMAEQAVNPGESFGGTGKVEKPAWLDDMQTECDDIISSYSDSVERITEARSRLTAALSEKQEKFSGESAFVNGSNFADALSDKMEKLQLQATILTDKMQKLAQSDNPDQTQWNMLEKQLLAVRLQYQAIEQQTRKNATAVEELGDKSKKTKGFLGKMFDKFKNVMFYRLVRTMLAQMTRAISAGLENVAKFSSEANSILSEYKTEFTYIQNSMGAALLPVLQSLLPTIIRISDGLVDITNSIGMVSAALNGQSTFIKAKKYVQDYAEAVDDAKKSTTGFDELNILGNNTTSQTDASQMFETVDISGWDVAGAIAKLTALVGTVTALVALIKGAKIKDAFVGMGKGLKTAYDSIKNTAKWKKAIVAIAAIAVEATAVGTAVYDMASGNKGVVAGLIEIGVVGTAAFFALSAAFNSTGIGLIITLVVAGIAAIVGGMKAVSEKAKDREMQKFWEVSGVAIENCTTALDNYFRALGISKQQEWNETLEEANNALIDANFNYNTLWASIKGDNISTGKIQQLSEAFQDLADAATAVNDAAIGSLMSSIKTGIEMNITPELTERLGGLINQLETAQDLLNIKIQGINSEYQGILNDIKNNGGNVTSEQRAKLEELREQMNKYTLSDNTAAESWSMSLQEAKNKGINAGFDKEAVSSALDDLVKKRDEYLETLSTNYASSRGTLKQLIELDKTEYGGALGFSDADLATLAESYNAQLEEVNKQFNEIIQGVYNGLNANAMENPHTYWGQAFFSAFYNWDYWGEKDAYDEQQEILDMINGYKGNVDDLKQDVSATSDNFTLIQDLIKRLNLQSGDRSRWGQALQYATLADGRNALEVWRLLTDDERNRIKGANEFATGGFPEDGLFFANHSELVGKFSNGKTAVANNEQIVEGIKRGVSEAMSESGGSDGGTWVIQIVDTDGNIKGEKIIKAAERKNRRDGKTVISIGG